MDKLKAVLMDEKTLLRSMARITHEIIERNKDVEDICIIGIKRRGESLANMVTQNILQFEGKAVPCTGIDIRLYRDDLTELADSPITKKMELPFSIVGKRVVLVDDVIYTGRTVRAAIDCLLSFGRPRVIQLAVLIDRGHRELPIRPDYVGKNIPTSREEKISVMLPPYDKETGVQLFGKAD